MKSSNCLLHPSPLLSPLRYKPPTNRRSVIHPIPPANRCDPLTMFPPNNPHYPRNRSCTRCLNGTKRKGLYAVLTIGIFLCIILAINMMYVHQVLDSGRKQHVFSTMHQSYNAESPKFVNESRRREADTQQHKKAANLEKSSTTEPAITESEISDSRYFPQFRNLVSQHCILLESDETTEVNQNAESYNKKLDAAVTRLLQNIFEDDRIFRIGYQTERIYPTRVDKEWPTLRNYITKKGTSSHLQLKPATATAKVVKKEAAEVIVSKNPAETEQRVRATPPPPMTIDDPILSKSVQKRSSNASRNFEKRELEENKTGLPRENCWNNYKYNIERFLINEMQHWTFVSTKPNQIRDQLDKDYRKQMASIWVQWLNDKQTRWVDDAHTRLIPEGSAAWRGRFSDAQIHDHAIRECFGKLNRKLRLAGLGDEYIYIEPEYLHH